MPCSFKTYIIFAFVLTLGIWGFIGASIAQEEDTISTSYLDDMKDFYQECEGTPTLKNAYDCRCLSVQYLDKIQILGSYERSEVVESLDKFSCPRTSGTLAREKMRDIPQAYLDEAQSFYDSCGNHIVYESHYDCECLSSEYLDQRIELGRFADSSLIKMNISKSCPSKAAAAGYAYQECMKSGYTIPTRFEIEDYCTCTANEYAKLFALSGFAVSPKLMINLQTKAALYCHKTL